MVVLRCAAQSRPGSGESTGPGQITRLLMNCAQFRRNLTGILSLSSFISAGFAATSSDKISYNRDIRPVLSDNCFFCHGPDKNKRKGKLRLDVREEAIAKQAIVPGKPEESELIKRVFTSNADDLMPPPESHKILAPAQKQLFRRRIAQGAEYQKQWADMTP